MVLLKEWLRRLLLALLLRGQRRLGPSPINGRWLRPRVQEDNPGGLASHEVIASRSRPQGAHLRTRHAIQTPPPHTSRSPPATPASPSPPTHCRPNASARAGSSRNPCSASAAPSGSCGATSNAVFPPPPLPPSPHPRRHRRLPAAMASSSAFGIPSECDGEREHVHRRQPLRDVIAPPRQSAASALLPTSTHALPTSRVLPPAA